MFRFLVAAIVRSPLTWHGAGAVLVLLAVLTGCSTLQHDIAINPNESVAIVVSEASGWPRSIQVRNESVGPGSREALAGMGAGALAGGAWGFACGPLAALCVPLGAIAGVEVGLVAGLAVGTTAALPADTADRLRAGVTRALQSHDMRSELEAEVVERAKNHWILSPDQPTLTVAVELREIVLASTRDERIRCVVTVAVTVDAVGAKQPRHGKQRVYVHVSPYGSLALWLEEGGGLVDVTLANASRELATQIVSGLAAKR